MRYSEIIAEARRRSDVNLTIPVNAWINNYFREVQQKGDSVGNSVVLNLFVSLTSIPKLGINPRSHYNTPLGIYAYPAEYVIQKIGRKLPLNKLPFAGDEPWVNIFRVSENSNVIDLDEVTQDMYNEYCQRFVEILSKRYESPLETTNKAVVVFKDEANREARVTTPGGKLWYVSMEVSKAINNLYREKTRSVTWNKLFRDVGIDGFIDMGKGIIHPSEPTQAVFFSMKPIQVLDRVQNKYSPDTREKEQFKGQAKKEEFEQMIKEFRQIIATGDIAEIEDWMAEAGYRSGIKPSVWINNVPVNLRAKLLFKNTNGLMQLTKPTKSDYFSALVGNPHNVLVYFRGLYDKDVYESQALWTKFLTPQELAQALYQSKNYAKSKMDIYTSQELLRYIKFDATKSGIDLTTPANSVVLKALINLSPGLFRPMLAYYANEGKMLDKDIYEYALTLADGKEKVEITKYWDYFNKQASDIEDMLTQVKS
jgi:hypothetical protein